MDKYKYDTGAVSCDAFALVVFGGFSLALVALVVSWWLS